MKEIQIKVAKAKDYINIKELYYEVTDALAHSKYSPGWIRDIYPTQEFIQDVIAKGEMYLCMKDEILVGCMVVNHDCNDGYHEIQWKTNADPEEILVIHALCVHPDFAGQGIAKEMVREVIRMAKANGIKSIRLDVLEGNLPAEKAYKSVGFQYLNTVKMFYEDTGWTGYELYEFVV